MYAIAQHVKASTGEEGINAFLFDGVRAKSGERLQSVVGVKKPGEDVEGYLDLEFPAGVPRSELEALLTSLAKAASQKPGELVALDKAGVARAEFMVGPRQADAWMKQFDLLKASLLGLLKD